MIWGGGKLMMVGLKQDFSGVKEGTERVLIENASAPAGDNIMLPAEGSQLFKVNGKYYLFNIVWPRGGMRTVLIHRADKITGPYEGRVDLQDKGVAKGGRGLLTLRRVSGLPISSGTMVRWAAFFQTGLSGAIFYWVIQLFLTTNFKAI